MGETSYHAGVYPRLPTYVPGSTQFHGVAGTWEPIACENGGLAIH